MSLGHLILAWSFAALPIVSAVAIAQASESSSVLHLLSVRRTEQRMLAALPPYHFAPALPRPAVCSSANTARPSLFLSAAYSAAMSLVLDVQL
jgi:hypothetical protein